jgi:hypothetical protein
VVEHRRQGRSAGSRGAVIILIGSFLGDVDGEDQAA